MTEKELLVKIGRRIKDIRMEKGISQQELGAEINYEKSNMSRLEAGGTNVTVKTLFKVAGALKVSLKDIVDVK